MIVFPGYIHLEQVNEFSHSIIYRAELKKSRQPVIIKLYKKKYPQKQLTEIKEKLTSRRTPKSVFLARQHEVLDIQGKIAIVLKDPGSMFLSVILLNTTVSISLFLKLAIRITKNLGVIHAKQIIHNDIRPQNILVNEKTEEVTFTGHNSQKISLSKYNIETPQTLDEDAFVFTAPEQTGRINWKIDQRSDLYSLGATFYKMLSGDPPFKHDSPQKRIQSHLVIEPESLNTTHGDIPPVIDKIVLKLLDKSSDERYQSAYGLLNDLEICFTQYSKNKKIRSFELAKKDNIERFHIASKLYGSQKDFVSLMESYIRVGTGSVEMIMVKGRPGIGKTTLILELLEFVRQKGGYIAYGKCEKEYRDTPYYSLILSFQLLIQEILNNDKTKLAKLKERFLEAIGHNGQLIIDLIPAMEKIIGKQPAVPRVDPDETQNRLRYIFGKFIHAFTIDSNPLVIFLDNFHWADSATIQLIQSALSDLSSRYVMLVMAYQEELVIHSHTFSITLDEITRSGTQIQHIEVNPLTLDDICMLIEEVLSFKQDFKSLARFILDKTDGNPYFVKQLLKTLYDRKLIFFDAGIGQWSWNIKQIKKAKLSGDIIGLMVDKVKSQQRDTIEIMKLASCLGTQFDSNILTMATGKDEKTIQKLLSKAVETDLIKPTQRRRYPNDVNEFGPQSIAKGTKTFQFSHSRVLRATYSLMTLKEKKSNHLMLGRLLQKTIQASEIDQNLYQIIGQMNQGIQLIRKQSERHELARLNLIAGKKSKAAAAFETAWKYFSIGSELLSESSWEKDYDLTKELYLKRSECEYFVGNTEAAEPIFDLLLGHIKTNREKVEVLNLKLNLYIKNNRLEKAVEIGLEALRTLFKEQIPPNDAEITIVSQIKMQDIQSDLERKKIANLISLPAMTDPDQKALMDLITNIIPAAYIVKRNLWILLTLKMVDTSLKYGNTDVSAFGFMNYAVILCSGLQDYTNGYTIGRLSLDLNNKFNNVGLISQLNFLFGSYIGHWKNKASENLTYLKRSYQAGIKHGDFLSAGLSVDFLMKSHIIIGSPLEEIQKEAKKHQDFVDQLNNPDLENILRISNLMTVFRESSSDSKDFLPDLSHMDNLLQSITQTKNSQLLQWYYLITAQIHFFFYNYSKALELIQESDKMISSYSQLAIPEHYFYYSLIILENYASFNSEEKKRYWDILKSNYQKLASLAMDCLINFSDKSLLIEAQMASISGNYIKASDLFDNAIQSANENEFVQNEALANEMAAKYFLSKNKITIAAAYIRKACRAYIKWGATAKIKHLEQCYPMLLQKRRRYDDLVKSADDPNKIALFTNLSTIIKASQEISEKTALEKIIEKLMLMLLENTNALKSYFLLENDNQINIIMEGVKKDSIKFKQFSTPLEEFEEIAQSVVFYTIRTRKLIVLNDASKDGMFAYNSYIKKTGLKSILCVPFISHKKLIAILYLENTDSSGVFSPRMVELLTVLLSQVSISIQNALLRTNMVKITKEHNVSRKKLEKRIHLLEQDLESRIV